MTSIDQIQLIVDASNGAWEYGAVAGTATEFVKIDSVSLTQIPEPATLGLIAAFGGGIMFIRRRFMI
jgi:hypothetical protein